MPHIVVKHLGVKSLIICISKHHGIRATVICRLFTVIRTEVVRSTHNIKNEVPVDEANHPVVHVTHDVMGIVLPLAPDRVLRIRLSNLCCLCC